MAGFQSMAGSIQISSTACSSPDLNVADVAMAPSAPSLSPEELAKSDLWIFREGRREISGSSFLRDLQQRLEANGALLDTLIQAGELEAALGDADAPHIAIAAALTDALACQVCQGSSTPSTNARQLAQQISVPAIISIAPPEGFTYYALHPLDYARAAEAVCSKAKSFAVVGIRSIGTTLSAVTAAALNALGKPATRITVRPCGHPYSRTMQFSPQQQRWIKAQILDSAHFLVVDEGPGRSGSTFLSVAEALLGAGVARERITILGSRAFDPASLCAEAAAQRWRRFHFVATTPSFNQQFADWLYIGNGEWRKHFCHREQDWPESWTQMERFKVLSPDGRQFVKFEGMGRIGNEVRGRAFALAEAGFSPPASDIGNGFLSYSAVQGKHLHQQNLNSDVLEQIARYCAFRVCEFRQAGPVKSELEHMLKHNVQEEFGRELKLPAGCLHSSNPVIVDGRMQPCEWIASHGKLLKTDAISHGDNHFFPGPCGIEWDLAGAVVEWDMGPDGAEFLLAKFRQFSGIHVSAHLNPYLLTYIVFRLGFCKMARSTVLGSGEEKRLDSAYRHYRARAAKLLDSFAAF